jgi:hypothetical protein
MLFAKRLVAHPYRAKVTVGTHLLTEQDAPRQLREL